MRARCAALLLVLAGCGGHVQQNHAEIGDGVDAADGVGESGGASDAQPGNDAGASDSVPGSEGGAGSGGTLGTAGAGPVVAARIASGTRHCLDEHYCFGLSCYAPLGLPDGVCIGTCGSDADCGLAGVCLASADLEPGCYQQCDTPFDCEYGFDCFDFAKSQQMLVCFPTSWAADWERNQR